MRVLPELIEAAARAGNTELANDALGRLAEWTQAAGTCLGRGIEARSRALLSDSEQADCLYREAIARFGRTRLRPDLARAYRQLPKCKMTPQDRAQDRARSDGQGDHGHDGANVVALGAPWRLSSRRPGGGWPPS